MQHAHAMEYYPVFKKKEMLPCPTPWVELESAVSNGISKAQDHEDTCICLHVSSI
jgi:hypothetical protein